MGLPGVYQRYSSNGTLMGLPGVYRGTVVMGPPGMYQRCSSNGTSRCVSEVQ